jgi:hypothetical protein
VPMAMARTVLLRVLVIMESPEGLKPMRLQEIRRPDADWIQKNQKTLAVQARWPPLGGGP